MRDTRLFFASAASVALFGLSPLVPAQTTMKMNISISQNSHYGAAVDTFAREVEKNTNGRYKIQNFYSGALGAERESIEATQLGTGGLNRGQRGF